MLRRSEPILALAPMQDVTDLPFWRVMQNYGGADVYYTEYFRVHGSSKPEKHILPSIVENPTGRPVIAQMIGNDIPALVRTAKELQQYPIVAVDLNLGCPAPIVYKKCAGGGLLREPHRVDAILGALRDAIEIKFTVKTRLGFESLEDFDLILRVFAKHRIDLLTVHGRTVAEGYRPPVHYGHIAEAVSRLSCPVLANGNIFSVMDAESVLAQTRARGLMLGRGAIRNPWLFHQIRQQRRGEILFVPRGYDLLRYIRDLFETLKPQNLKENLHVQKMKKYMNFIGEALADKDFLFQIKRVNSEADFFEVCKRFLDHDQPMELAPVPRPPTQAMTLNA